MPVADAVAVAELPSEVHLASATRRSEVDEALIGILHLGTEPGDLEKQRVDLLRDRIGRPPIVRRLATHQIFEQGTDLGEGRLGLRPRERRHMLSREYGAAGGNVATYVLLT